MTTTASTATATATTTAINNSIFNTSIDFFTNGDANSNGIINFSTKIPFEQRMEDRLYNSLMLILTGLGYFLISFVFLFRLVLLWFLIILSPFLFLLIVLPALREYFRYWSWIFARWIFIGPILAICLGASVFIWHEIGIPVTSLYSSDLVFDQSGNFKIASPGSTTTGLNYTKPMVEYIIALIMLYIPVILAFWLTRRVYCCESAMLSKNNKMIMKFLSSSKYGGSEPTPSPNTPNDPNNPNKLADLKETLKTKFSLSEFKSLDKVNNQVSNQEHSVNLS